MSAVTESVVLPLKAGASPTEAAQAVTSLVLQQPGALRARYAPKHESPEDLAMFIDWEDLSAHQAFMDSDIYKGFLEDVGKYMRAPPIMSHVPFVPFPPAVLDNDEGKGQTAVAEVIHAYFPAAGLDMVRQQEILAQAQQFLDESKKIKPKGFSGQTAHGFALEDLEHKGEKSRALLLVLGWDSIDSHVAYRETEDFARTIPLLRTLPGLKGMEVWHVSNAVVTK